MSEKFILEIDMDLFICLNIFGSKKLFLFFRNAGKLKHRPLQNISLRRFIKRRGYSDERSERNAMNVI
jgi:hypothetical protein